MAGTQQLAAKLEKLEGQWEAYKASPAGRRRGVNVAHKPTVRRQDRSWRVECVTGKRGV
jgi:hypothetical protein